MAETERPRVRVLCAGLALGALWMAIGSGCIPPRPQAEPGRKEFQSLGWVPVPHGMVNMIAGNLLIERSDLDLDTQVGRLDLGATWNSATRDWVWSFEPTYDGTTFRDASGAVHEVAGLEADAPILGTHWVREDEQTVRTRGGLVYEFDGAGRLAVVRWRSGSWPQLLYVGSVVGGETRTVEIRQYETASNWTRLATIERDAAGRVQAIEDRTGRRAEYQRDGAGRLVVARDALDLEEGWPGFRYEYSSENHISAITNSEGERTEYEASALRTRLIRAIGLGNPTWRLAYEKTGAVSSAELEGPLGERRVWRYDDQRRVLERENEAGEVASFEWNGLRPREFTTPAGVTTYYHVVDDDLVHILQPSGNVVDIIVAPNAENRGAPTQRAVAEVRDSVGLVQSRTYDAVGRLVSMSNGEGDTWRFSWNARGLLADLVDPRGRTTRYRDYGVHGHPRHIEIAGGEVDLDWDAVGNLQSPGAGGGSGPGGVIERRYDADRNLSRLVLGDLDQLASLTTRNLDLTYRSDGRLLRIDRPYGGDTEWVYDALGRRSAQRDFTNGAWRTKTWQYDTAGRVLAQQRPNGMRTEWQYDAAGRATRIAHERAGVEEQSATLSWTAGRLSELNGSEAGLETFEYDPAGRIDRIVDAAGDTRTLGYDARSRIVSEFYQLGAGWPLADVQVVYDDANREVELRRGSQLLRRRTFVAGRVVVEEFGNGLVRTDGYDPDDGLLASAELRSAGGATLASAALTRDFSEVGTGLLLWDIVATTSGAVSATTEEQHYLGPLSPGEPGPRIGVFGAGSTPVLTGRVWDELSNPVAIGHPGEPEHRTFHYDSERTRLLTVRNGSGGIVHGYAFDSAGFATLRDGDPVVWDAGGRPVSASGVSWSWDTLGRLRGRVEGAAVTLRRFGGRVEVEADGTPIQLDLGAVVLDLTSGGGNHRFRHLDFRGNVKWVSDMSGAVVAHFGYGPHGVHDTYGATNGEPSFAQGQSAGELLRLGHRLYDAEVGRFLAPDPVFQVVNSYGYTLGDPIHFWDPSGRQGVSALTVARGVAYVGAMGGAVAVASALSIGAPAVVVTYGLVLALGSTGVAAGLLVPVSPRLAASSIAVAAVLNSPLSSPFTGFTAGQVLQAALAEAGEAVEASRVAPGPEVEVIPEPGPPGDPVTGKTLEFRLGNPSPGCSPSGLAGSTPAVPRQLLLMAGIVQIVAAVWLVRRTRRRS